MKNSKWILATAILMSACGKGVPVMGIDQSGQARKMELSGPEYSAQLNQLLQEVNEKTLPAIENAAAVESRWKLKTVLIGLGLKVEAGFGPYKVGMEPRIRMAYANDKKAPIP